MTRRRRRPKATRREWIGLAVIALPCMLYSMDLTVLNLAVPQLSADLKPSAAQLLWIVDIYGFLVAGSLILMGTLGDRIGRRKLLLIGAAAFGIASVLAAFSTSAEMLIADPRAPRRRRGDARARRRCRCFAACSTIPASGALRSAYGSPATRSGGAIGPLIGGVAASIFLVGLGVPARRAGHASPPRARSGAPARIPRSERRKARFRQRGPVARLRARGDLWPEADRAGWIWSARRARHPRRPRRRHRLRPSPA